MIHFDWDILGVNLETFSPEKTLLQPCLGETTITPKQVELFTSLLRKEATAVETSSFKPTMFPQSIIMPKKPQHVRQMPANVATNAPATENTTPSGSVSSTQVPTTQQSFAQMLMTQKSLIVQTQSAQELASTPYITVKASVSAPLQPMTSLVNLEVLESPKVLDHLESPESLETAAMPLVMENAKPSLQELSVQLPMPQKLSVQIPTPQKPSVQMPTPQMPSAQIPVAQMPILTQKTSAQEPASMPYSTIKASVSTLLQPTAPLESLGFLEPLVHLEPLKNLEPLETASIAPAMENITPSTEALSTQISVAQMPAVAQTTSAQVPASTPNITVKASVSAPLQPMASLENLEALESLEVLDHPEPLETAQKPVLAATNTPALENDAQHSVQMPTAQKPVNAQIKSAQMPIMAAANAPAMENTMPSVEVPSMQIPTAQMPFMQEPVAQKPTIVKTESAQDPVNTPYITVKASVSTPLQPTTAPLESLVFLEPLKNLEPLETAAMAPAMENTTHSMEAPSTQMPTAQMPVNAQTVSAQNPVNTPYITIKASVSTLLQPTTVPLESLVFLEPLVSPEPLNNLEPLETVSIAPAMEHTKLSMEVPSSQILTVQVPSMQVPTAQMLIIEQIQSAQKSVNTPYITVKTSVSAPLQSMASLGALEVLENPEPQETAQMPVMTAVNAPTMDNAKSSVQELSVQMPMLQKPSEQISTTQVPLAELPVAQMPLIQVPSTQVPTDQKPVIPELLSMQKPTAQMPSTQEPVAQISIIAQTVVAKEPANTPYITVKASVSAPLQPKASLENLEVLDHLKPLETAQEPVMAAVIAPAMENIKSSTEKPIVELPMTQKPLTMQTASVQEPFTQMPSTQKSSAQVPVAQKSIIAPTQSAQISANTPYITVKASVSAPLQPMASLESLDIPEPLDTAAMAPVIENTTPFAEKPIVQKPIAQLSSTQIPMAQVLSTQIPMVQKPVTTQMPIIAQTASAQMPAMVATNAPATENAKQPSVEVPSTQLPMAQMPSTHMPAVQKPVIVQMPSTQVPTAQISMAQIPTAQMPSTQEPVAQISIIAQTVVAKEPANTPYITVKASVSAPLQTMASLENLEALEVLEPLETAQKPVIAPVSTPAMGNTHSSAEKPSVELSMVQIPILEQTTSAQVSTVQKPVIAQKPLIIQTLSAQVPASTPYITIKASVSAPLQPMAFLENLEALESLEVLENLVSLETAQKPVIAAVSMPAMGNSHSSAEKPSVELSMAQIPILKQTTSAQVPMVQKPVIVQKPLIIQTLFAQVPASTPYITVKASDFTLLQPMASLENLEALESLEVPDHLVPPKALEMAAMPLAMENTMPSVQMPAMQIPMAQKSSTQVPVTQKSLTAQTMSAQEPASTPYITVTVSGFTLLQPMASLENLEALESLEVLDHPEPLENAQMPIMVAAANAPAMENTMPSVQHPSVQTPTTQKPVIEQMPSTQVPTAQMPMVQNLAITQTPFAQMPIMAATNAPAMENAKQPSVEVPSTQVPTAQIPSTQVPTAQMPMVQNPAITQTPFAQMPIMAVANVPAMENAKPSAEVPSTQVPTAQIPSTQVPTAQTPLIAQMPSTQTHTAQMSMAQIPMVQMPSTQMPVITQTLSAQESVNTPYIIVKAPVSVLLQPTASLEIAQMPVMAATNAPATENAKLSVEVPSTQMPIAQTPYTQVPTAQKLVFTHMPSMQMPIAQTPVIAQTLSAQEPVVIATSKPIMENATSSVEVPFTQVPTTQMPPMQELVVQKPIIAQTVSAQMPVNTPHITVKVSVAVPLQPMASLENLEALVPLETLDMAAMPHAIENAKSSVQQPYVQTPTAQKPSVQIPSTQMLMAQMPVIAQTLSAQMPVYTPYITVKASISAPLQPMASLENLETLEVLEPLETAQKPVMATANTPTIENTMPSMEVPYTQIPIVQTHVIAQMPSMQPPTAQTPMAQMPSTELPVAQMPTLQKPIIAQTQSAQEPASTPNITVKASVSTPLQSIASQENLVPLELLEVLETATMPYATESTTLFAQLPMAQMLSTQIPVTHKPITVQTQSAQEPASTPYIMVKAPVSTPLQPMASLDNLEALESVVVLDHLEPLEVLEMAVMPPAMENAKPSMQEASVQMPMSQKPSVQMPAIRKSIIEKTQSAQESASTPYIAGKVSVSAPQQPMASLETAAMAPATESTKPSAQLPIAQMPEAQMPSTQVSVAHKPITIQTSSSHISTKTPYITIKASHSFTQKLEASQKPLKKPSSMPDVVAPNIHPAATAISQPTDLAMPSVTTVKTSSMAMSPDQILSSTVNELTSAIMVNIDENGHLGEIRLVLKPDVLDGTTILLKCDQKQISVTFFPGAESAEQLLMANQSRIAETLAATGHLPVKISIINSEGRRQIRKIA